LKWFKSHLTVSEDALWVTADLARALKLWRTPRLNNWPLLFLIYINDLLNCLNAGFPRMYEDDTNVTFSAPTIPDLESQVNNKVKGIDLWLKANKLSVDVPKTEFMIVTSRQKVQFLNDYTINIDVDVSKNNS